MLKILYFLVLFSSTAVSSFEQKVLLRNKERTTSSPVNASRRVFQYAKHWSFLPYGATPPHYNPNYGYEPYWVDGKWIYNPPIPEDQTARVTYEQVCGEDCLHVYANIGPICAHREHRYSDYSNGCFKQGQFCWNAYPDDFTNTYIDFTTYCQFLNAQCRSNEPYRWVFVHQGKCIRDQLGIYKYLIRGTEHMDRTQLHIKEYKRKFTTTESGEDYVLAAMNTPPPVPSTLYWTREKPIHHHYE